MSVYTLEQDFQRQTVMNYNTGRPYKNYEQPPAYADAIQMHNISSSVPPPPQYSTANSSTMQFNQQQTSIPIRRNSATI